MFYEFDQNNSGVSFHIDDEAGIGPRVWIEADTPEEANEQAESIGIYFNGVEEGRDCECCGDRWSEASDWNAHETCEVNTEWDFFWHDTVYLHDKNGTIHRLTKADAENGQKMIEGGC